MTESFYDAEQAALPRPAKLYAPPAYVADDPVAIVRAYPFAMVVSPGLQATATPICFEHPERADRLVGHFARNNPHAQGIEDGQDVLTIFNGPHAYISPNWYVERPTVPTWNYVTAHVRGTIEPLDDEASILAILGRTAAVSEAGFDLPWTMAQAPEGRVAHLLPMVRAFRIHVRTIEGVTKLSQTHPPGDRVRIVDGLRALPPEHDIATLITELPDAIRP